MDEGGRAEDVRDRAIMRAARNDPAAFAPLYEHYHPAIRAYCFRRLGDPEAAADAAVDTFVRALQRLDTFHPSETSTVRAWLFAIAHNTVVDTHRRNVFRRQRTSSLDQPASTTGDSPTQGDRLIATDPLSAPEAHAIAGETISRVREALQHLPERQRRIVELRLAGLTGDEIATVLGMTLGAVKAAQFRAFGTLRPILDDLHATTTTTTTATTIPEESDAATIST